MAITIDTRLHVAGDMMVVTGTFGNTDASIDLSDHLSTVFFAGCNGTTDLAEIDVGGTGFRHTPNIEIDGTTLRFKTIGNNDVAGTAGKFFAIGKR
tara:strand:+ start:699 stop:986 length:288 start_codon:yes stop_codon:yes gene_type:complete